MDAVEFVQTKPYAGNRLRIEIHGDVIRVILTSETGNLIDKAEFNKSHPAWVLASWIEYRANW